MTSIEIVECLLKSTGGSTDAVFVWGNESDKKGDKKILEFLKSNPIATIKDMRELTGLSSGGIQKVLNRLKRAHRLRQVGPEKGGHWEVLEFEP